MQRRYDEHDMPIDRPMRLLAIAREISSREPSFQVPLGPGVGNRASNAFVRALQKGAYEAFAGDFSEQKICGETSQAVDYYFPQEATIVEVALGLPNPASEFEKDVLKAIMAKENGYRVTRLFFISRPGAIKKCAQPGRMAVQEWARAKHAIHVEVHELEGIPRKRARSRKSAV